MIKIVVPVLLVAGAAVVASAAYQPAPAAAVPRHAPVLVELYQSQGCSSCPPANANLNAIAGRPDVVALSFGVTYWDQLGWKDSFASPQFTARQWDYASFNRRENVATPQMWINGRQTIVGGNGAELANAVRHASSEGPAIKVGTASVEIGAGTPPRTPVGVWLARYDPRTVPVAIRAGENGGRTLPHRNIVKSLTLIGRWAGKAENIALPKATGGYASAVFLQVGKGGPVLAVAKG